MGVVHFLKKTPDFRESRLLADFDAEKNRKNPDLRAYTSKKQAQKMGFEDRVVAGREKNI